MRLRGAGELGLDARATADDVRAAFRRKAKATHPDQGGNGDMGRLVQLRDLALAYVLRTASSGGFAGR